MFGQLREKIDKPVFLLKFFPQGCKVTPLEVDYNVTSVANSHCPAEIAKHKCSVYNQNLGV